MDGYRGVLAQSGYLGFDFGGDALGAGAGAGEGLGEVAADAGFGGQIADYAAGYGGDDLAGVAAVAPLPEDQGRGFAGGHGIAESGGDYYGEKDGGAVEGAVGVGFGALLYGNFGEGVEAGYQLAGLGAAVQVDYAGGGVKFGFVAEGAVHQRE